MNRSPTFIDSRSHILELDTYERDNLAALLHVIMVGKLGLNTGDWLHQVYHKVTGESYNPKEHKPNMTPEEQLKMLGGRK